MAKNAKVRKSECGDCDFYFFSTSNLKNGLSQEDVDFYLAKSRAFNFRSFDEMVEFKGKQHVVTVTREAKNIHHNAADSDAEESAAEETDAVGEDSAVLAPSELIAIEEQDNLAFLDRMHCSCQDFHKKYICEHVLTVAIANGWFSVKPTAKSTTVDFPKKRRVGRPTIDLPHAFQIVLGLHRFHFRCVHLGSSFVTGLSGPSYPITPSLTITQTA